VADLVESQQHVLATIEALDNGKPYSQALGDIEDSSPSNAARAAQTALSTSSTVAAWTEVISSSVL
jgi:acyl-CoA reductase-like NAD-dependent aldehyde dehydrogenase